MDWKLYLWKLFNDFSKFIYYREIGCLTIINVENYKNIRSIKTGDKVLISVCYKFNDTILFTGDVAGNIKQWKIENEKRNNSYIKITK